MNTLFHTSADTAARSQHNAKHSTSYARSFNLKRPRTVASCYDRKNGKRRENPAQPVLARLPVMPVLYFIMSVLSVLPCDVIKD